MILAGTLVIDHSLVHMLVVDPLASFLASILVAGTAWGCTTSVIVPLGSSFPMASFLASSLAFA